MWLLVLVLVVVMALVVLIVVVELESLVMAVYSHCCPTRQQHGALSWPLLHK